MSKRRLLYVLNVKKTSFVRFECQKKTSFVRFESQKTSVVRFGCSKDFAR